MERNKVLSSVKDPELVKMRREQMIKASLILFKEKGFHRTTTREIAKKSGFSIGTLYEYIRTKEDVLFLVCDRIYEEVQHRLESKIDFNDPSVDKLIEVVKSYFYLMDDMQEEVLLLYQELKSLTDESKEYVIENEFEMVSMLKRVIVVSLPFKASDQEVELLANNIFVQGQMWSFRRWILHKRFTLEEYIDLQLGYLLKSLQLETTNK